MGLVDDGVVSKVVNDLLLEMVEDGKIQGLNPPACSGPHENELSGDPVNKAPGIHRAKVLKATRRPGAGGKVHQGDGHKNPTEHQNASAAPGLRPIAQHHNAEDHTSPDPAPSGITGQEPKVNDPRRRVSQSPELKGCPKSHGQGQGHIGA